MRRKESERMGNEAAEHSGELIHYLATEVAPGFVVHMQTMYMTWITMAIVFMLIFFAAKNPKMVPSGVQNVVEFFIDFLNELMEGQLGIKGRKYMAPFIITLFMFIFISNELGLLPQVGVHWTSPTNDINTCFALSLTVAIGVHIIGICQKAFWQIPMICTPIATVRDSAKQVLISLVGEVQCTPTCGNKPSSLLMKMNMKRVIIKGAIYLRPLIPNWPSINSFKKSIKNSTTF